MKRQRREETHDSQGICYCFNKGFHEDSSAFIVDSENYGNMFCFFNHLVSHGLVNTWYFLLP